MAREWIFENSHFIVGIGRNRRCFICHGNLLFFNQIFNLVLQIPTAICGMAFILMKFAIGVWIPGRGLDFVADA